MDTCRKVRPTALALALAAFVAMLLATVPASQPARAAGPWYVAPGGSDGNDCLNSGPTHACATINGALAKATAGDTILVAAGTYTGTGDQVVLLDKNATLSGGWNSGFTAQSSTSTIDGQGARRGITVNSGVTAMIESFTMQNGHATDGSGIYNADGTITLNASAVSGNTITGTGSHKGGGIYNSGVMTLNNSAVNGNAISLQWGSSEGVGIYNAGTLTLNNSAVSGNGEIGYGGGIYNRGTLTLNSSVISGNAAGNGGGGIYNYYSQLTLNSTIVSNNTVTDGSGGGIDNNGGTVNLNNSTVSGNKLVWGTGGGGIYNYGGTVTLNRSAVIKNTASARYGGGIASLYNGTLILNNSTVSGNTAGNGGGGIKNSSSNVILNSSTILNNSTLFLDPMCPTNGGGIDNSWGGTMTLKNSIVAGNMAAEAGPDCYGTISSSGYNLVGNTSGCTFVSTTGDLINLDAKLGPLEGFPSYHPLLSGSPAINAGNPAGCMGSAGLLTTDQRGAPRVGRCDIGAYEADLAAVKRVGGTLASGGLLAYTIVISNEAGITDLPGIHVTDTLPLSLTYVVNSFSATAGTGGESGGIITWAGALPAGGSATISFGTIVNDAMPSCSVVTNKAIVGIEGYAYERRATETTPCMCNSAKQVGGPVLTVGSPGSWDDDGVRGPIVLKEESGYKTWYTGNDGSNPSQIGLATSTDGLTWTKSISNPVLSPGPSWEAGGIRARGVIADGGLYKMWYTGFDSNGVGRIGYATSPDGMAWTKYGSSPVLSVGTPGSWEDDGVIEPTVIKEGGIYHMWYTGHDGITSRIGHATSSNGTTWTRDPANPVLDIGSPGGWDWLGIYGPSVMRYNDTFLLWYSGETLPKASQTGYVLSSDGNAWTRGKMLIPKGAAGTFDAASADYPSALADGDQFKVWYSGQDASGTYNIGYATAEVCGAAAPPSDFVYLPIVLQGGCPAYYTDHFSDPGSGWSIDDDAIRRYAYIGGQYQIWVKNKSYLVSTTPGAQATDFTAAVSARRASGSKGGYGIGFGINEDWSERYQVLIDANKYSIWRRQSGTWIALRNPTTSGYIKTGTNWNRLKVIRSGASIAVYVNDHYLTTVTDSSYTGLRRIGLVASSGGSPVDARFDNFALYPAECGVSAAGAGFEMGKPEIYEEPAPPGLDRAP